MEREIGPHLLRKMRLDSLTLEKNHQEILFLHSQLILFCTNNYCNKLLSNKQQMKLKKKQRGRKEIRKLQIKISQLLHHQYFLEEKHLKLSFYRSQWFQKLGSKIWSRFFSSVIKMKTHKTLMKWLRTWQKNTNSGQFKHLKSSVSFVIKTILNVVLPTSLIT